MQQSARGEAAASPGVSFEALKNWLVLWRMPGLGARRYLKLLEVFDSPDAVLSASVTSLKSAGMPEAVIDAILSPNWASIEPDMEWLSAPDHHLMIWQDTDYPVLLREIPDPPPLLFIHGQRELLNDHQLAIVGSRNPTPAGTQTAHDFAKELSGVGLTITSGMALGVDAAAHQGALAAGGPTLAVAATGLDRVYPARHHELANQITQQGALVSEFPIGTRPQAGYFPRRNRIISGLSLGVLVVEAARQSGSLVTARMAMEQGREVFAIPGSIHNPLAKGCHTLIQQGGKLVQSAQDILEELHALVAVISPASNQADAGQQQSPVDLPKSHQQLLDQVGFEPTSVDALVMQSGMTAQEISSMLLVLELQGYVSSTPGGCYYRLSTPE